MNDNPEMLTYLKRVANNWYLYESSEQVICSNVLSRAEYGEFIANHQFEFAQSLPTEGRVVVVKNIKKLELAA